MKVAIELWTGVLKFQVIVMDKKGTLCRFAGWGVIGWANENEVVLAAEYSADRQVLLAIGNISTGNVRPFYP